MTADAIVLCPGQGAQAVGMGKDWHEASDAAKAVFAEADQVLGDALGTPLGELCFAGPADRLNQTDAAQTAIYVCSVASWAGLKEQGFDLNVRGAAGLSLGEYTALHLAGVFSFADGLRLVATRGRLMQEACEAADSGMVALVGADEAQAQEVCDLAAQGQVLVPANYNAPGQVVISGDTAACERALQAAGELGLRATALTVAGAFHSPLMRSAADRMAEALAAVSFQSPNIDVWSNVTAQPHDRKEMELLKQRLVQQIVSPVKWAQSCQNMPDDDTIEWHELAPGAVLRGLMRRVDRRIKVQSHDEP